MTTGIGIYRHKVCTINGKAHEKILEATKTLTGADLDDRRREIWIDATRQINAIDRIPGEKIVNNYQFDSLTLAAIVISVATIATTVVALIGGFGL